MRKLIPALLVSVLLLTSMVGLASASTTKVKPNGATLSKAFFTQSMSGGKPGKPTSMLHVGTKKNPKPIYLVMTWTGVTPPAKMELALSYMGIPAGGTAKPVDIAHDGTVAAQIKGFEAIPDQLLGAGWSMAIVMNKKTVKTLKFSLLR